MTRPTVRDSMDRETSAIPDTTPILDAISLLIGRGLTGVPVLDAAGKVVGVLSEEHCLRLVTEGDQKTFDVPKETVAAYCDATVPHVSPDMDLYYVAGMFLRERQHRRFPVVENGKLVGVITRKDILKALFPLAT